MGERVEMHPRQRLMDGLRADRTLEGGGDAGALMRSIDWSKTVLGPVEEWSQALRSTVALVLHNECPMLLWWGPEFVQAVYNDAYRPVLGEKHPQAMGQRFRDCWSEVWDVIGPMAERPFRGGGASTSDDLFLAVRRKGFLEEAHFRVAYSPVPDETVPETGIGGVLATVTETTHEHFAQRELRTLRLLGQRSSDESQTVEQACAAAAATLEQNAWDVPFALFYLTADGGERLRLAASVGFSTAQLAEASSAEGVLVGPGGAWPLYEVLADRQPVVVEDLGQLGSSLPLSPWREHPRSAMVMPMFSADEAGALGVLVFGVSPHRELDDGYRTFFELASAQVVTALRNARACEAAKRRSDELAALDRAKTSFFSNVSHEFRTPLTLMLGPTEDALASPSRALTGEALETVHRNELRLLKLVNNLLDFARLEAQRVQASYAPTDIARLTRELGAMFETAMRRAGLSYRVDAPPLDEPVYLDRDMYEKIVLNLLSNALKFTFDGAVEVSLRDRGAAVELIVRDSGVGVAASEVPRLFERFHRVEGTRARTHEGSGIGLALVHDLVGLHGGHVHVESELGKGTVVHVTLPKGTAHLPADRIRDQAVTSGSMGSAFVEEALRWLPETDEPGTVSAPKVATRPGRVLIVDDNADMRDYLSRALVEHWEVEVATDGARAFGAIGQRPPDVVITDVMMPNLDGFGLVRALRNDPTTASIPIIVLSARAGDESRVEGLSAGANDYLVKPFSTKELVARVKTQLELSRLRQGQELHRQRLHLLFEQAPAVICVLRGPEHVYELANPSYLEIVGRRPLLGRAIGEALPELAGQGIFERLDQAFTTGNPVVELEMPIRLERGGELKDSFWNFIYQPYLGADGTIEGVMCFGFEITAQVLARRGAEELMRQVQASEMAAEAANRAKDEFLAVLGHELRNPLSPIMTALHLMRLRDDRKSAKEREIIERQAHHLVTLVDDLLDVSRITRGKVELKRRKVEVAQVVARAIEMASPLLEQRQHRLTVEVASRGLNIDGDPDRLAQVLSNLLTNAAKYTERGGHVTISATQHEGEIVISVRDTGIGIAAEMLPRIFDMFVQDRQALDRAEGGLGLGLTIARSLVALHGGTVEVHSDGPNRGAEFVVRLPAMTLPHGDAVARSLDDGAAEAARSRAAHRRRILVVDDNEDAVELLAAALELAGHEVRVAFDGPTALNAVVDFVPDVALLDIGLPVMDGYELARRIHARPGLEHVRLVAVTGYGQEADRRRSAAAGFAAHLVKPVQLESLQATVEAAEPPLPKA